MGLITVELRTESGVVLDRLADGTIEFTRALPDFDDLDYRYLRLVDPYGDTVFSRYQMRAVVPELERLQRDKSSPALERVLQMARRCEGEVHSYLWLIGD